MITADGVTVRLGTTTVLHDVSLVAAPGRVVGLIGPNGSGKTTLLRTLHGGCTPAAGAIAIDGTPIGRMSARAIGRRVAVVAQHGAADLPFSVADVALLGRNPHLGPFARCSARDRRLAADALRRVGLRALAARPFATLSGGECQRAMIARALVQQADHLLLDEPTNHLDVRYQHDVLGLVRSLGLTTVVVLHDLDLAARYCDDLVVLDGGRVVATGRPTDVLHPDVLEPVWGIGVQRFEGPAGFHLAFHPRATDVDEWADAGPARLADLAT
jgi:iron complex transport system ATP-binding protein